MNSKRRPMYRTGFRSLALLLPILAAAQFGCTEKTSSPVVTLVPARDFGYTVGSLVEHRIVIELPPNASVDPKLLPSPGPVNDWLDLRTLRWRMPGDRRLHIDLGYLILKGAKEPEPVAIPPLTLGIRQGDAVTELQTPEWPFTLMPVIPPGIPDEKLEIRGMAALPASAGFPEVWMLSTSLLAAAACGFLIALRRGLFPALASPPPFTAAERELGKPDFSRSPAERYAAALKRLHRAIDTTAGETVFAAALPPFLDRHQAFRPLRAEFEQFFLASERHFFAGAEIGADAEERRKALVEFCRSCARAERGLR